MHQLPVYDVEVILCKHNTNRQTYTQQHYTSAVGTNKPFENAVKFKYSRTTQTKTTYMKELGTY
jgi:hypothetical protein